MDVPATTSPETVRGGASWLLWIAGISLLNSVSFLTDAGVEFFVALGYTLVIDGFFAAVAEELGGGGATVALAIGLLIDTAVCAAFALLGVFARRGRAWAFVVGLALYTVDALLFLAFQYWMGLAFHALALCGIWGGYAALRKGADPTPRLETAST